ncbi:MAG: hypothetical protein IKR79_00390 [Bacteroidales bacterium]|nr:hypothetical protein [Bacteroidales bacterium]
MFRDDRSAAVWGAEGIAISGSDGTGPLAALGLDVGCQRGAQGCRHPRQPPAPPVPISFLYRSYIVPI